MCTLMRSAIISRPYIVQYVHIYFCLKKCAFHFVHAHMNATHATRLCFPSCSKQTLLLHFVVYQKQNVINNGILLSLLSGKKWCKRCTACPDRLARPKTIKLCWHQTREERTQVYLTAVPAIHSHVFLLPLFVTRRIVSLHFVMDFVHIN